MLRAQQKRIVGGDHVALPVQHHDAVVNAVDHGFQAFALVTHLSHQTGNRIGHGVELARQPGNGVAAPGGYALRQVAARDLAGRGLEALQSPQHRYPDHHSDRPHQQQRDARGSRYQPAQVACHGFAQLICPVVQDQNAVDLIARVVAAEALRAVADGDHGAQHLAAAGLDHPARSSLRGRIAVAGLAGRSGDLQFGVRRSVPGGVALHTGAVQQHQPLHRGLLAEALNHLGDQRPLILDHLVFQRHANQIALGERGGARRLQQRLHVVLRIKECAAGTREHDSRGDSHSKTYGRAGERRLCAASHWFGRIMSYFCRMRQRLPVCQ